MHKLLALTCNQCMQCKMNKAIILINNKIKFRDSELNFLFIHVYKIKYLF